MAQNETLEQEDHDRFDTLLDAVQKKAWADLSVRVWVVRGDSPLNIAWGRDRDVYSITNDLDAFRKLPEDKMVERIVDRIRVSKEEKEERLPPEE